MVQNWNAKVPENAIVIIVGDVAMGGRSKAERVREILDSMNGKFILVKGNHDTYILDEPVISRFLKVCDYLECKVIRDNHKAINFVISHYPFLTWNGAGKKNVYHLHGHSHGNINHLNEGTTRLDVGMDNNNLYPFSFYDIMKIFDGVSYIPVDHHDKKKN